MLYSCIRHLFHSLHPFHNLCSRYRSGQICNLTALNLSLSKHKVYLSLRSLFHSTACMLRSQMKEYTAQSVLFTPANTSRLVLQMLAKIFLNVGTQSIFVMPKCLHRFKEKGETMHFSLSTSSQGVWAKYTVLQ